MDQLMNALKGQPTTLLALGLTALLLYKLFRKTTNSDARPPVVPYIIPWVGSAITMGKDPDAFFKSARSVLEF